MLFQSKLFHPSNVFIIPKMLYDFAIKLQVLFFYCKYSFEENILEFVNIIQINLMKKP